MREVKHLVIFLFVASYFLTNTASAHNLFIKAQEYSLKPDSNSSLFLLNGTFEISDHIVARERMRDVSIVGPIKNVVHPDLQQWSDQQKLTSLTYKAGQAGTYVMGVSLNPNTIELSPADFKSYLKHEGLFDQLTEFEKNGSKDKKARETYSKHVKAIIQVGDKHTNAYKRRLGYPVEIIPTKNPYRLKLGDDFEFLVLRDGKPLKNYLVYASYEGFPGHSLNGEHRDAIKMRTDKRGRARFRLEQDGRWYVRLIHLKPSQNENFDYESWWASLTFELK